MNRDASSTRAALLRSARLLFSQSPYSRVTTRAIAAHAGVDATLIARYFGSKPKLFHEALVGDDLDPPHHLEDAIYGRLEDIPAALARYVFHPLEDDAFDPLLSSLHSVAEPEGLAILHPMILDTIVSPLGARLRAAGQTRDEADRRARLVASILIGMSITRGVLPLVQRKHDQTQLQADLADTVRVALGISPAPPR